MHKRLRWLSSKSVPTKDQQKTIKTSHPFHSDINNSARAAVVVQKTDLKLLFRKTDCEERRISRSQQDIPSECADRTSRSKTAFISNRLQGFALPVCTIKRRRWVINQLTRSACSRASVMIKPPQRKTCACLEPSRFGYEHVNQEYVVLDTRNFEN